MTACWRTKANPGRISWGEEEALRDAARGLSEEPPRKGMTTSADDIIVVVLRRVSGKGPWRAECNPGILKCSCRGALEPKRPVPTEEPSSPFSVHARPTSVDGAMPPS